MCTYIVSRIRTSDALSQTLPRVAQQDHENVRISAFHAEEQKSNTKQESFQSYGGYVSTLLGKTL